MKKQLYFLIFIFCSCLSNLLAQQLYFNHLSVNNGLSQGVNDCIYRDSKGFVWISSYDGLNRFDGMSCTVFRSSINEASGLKGTLFLNILEDQNSNLWIGSNAGLNFYNRQLDVFQNFRIRDRSNGEQFYSPFYIDEMNNIWIQSVSDIIRFNPSTKTFEVVKHFSSPGNLIVKPLPDKPYCRLQQIFAVKNNLPVLWHGELGVKKIEWHSTSIPTSAKRITAILTAGEKRLWIGADNGVFCYQVDKKSDCINSLANQELKNVSALHLDRNGTLWAGTLQQGIFSIDTLSRTVKNHYTNSAYNNYTLAGKQIKYITSDDKGELWVSVWGKGVDYTSLNRFRFNHHVTKEEAVSFGSDNFIRSIIQVNDEFWCGTQASGILILDKNKKIKEAVHDGLPLSIEHLFSDENNLVWASTFEGLFLIDPLTKKISKLPYNGDGYGSASNQYNFISSLQNGTMLASTNAGLFFVDKVKGSFKFSKVKGIGNANNVFLTTYIDQLKHIYISQAFKGFSVYNLSKDSMNLITELPLEASIKCFTESNDSSLWIGSTIGLIRFNKYKLQLQQLFTTKEGLSNQYIYGILSDEDYLWFSTNAGINRMNIRNNAIKTFSIGDGLQSNEYNTYSYYKTKKGEFLFGGVNGVNSFFPVDFKSNSYSPQLVLTKLLINDSTFNSAVNPSEIKELRLKYHQNTVGFQFTVIQYANSEANNLNYILEGYDKSWVRAANKTQIRYSRIPSGHYTLKVRAYNADGIEANTIYSLPIYIKPPWWQSLWFKLLSVLSFLGLIHFISVAYLRMRLEKQRAQHEKKQAIEKERNRISRDMHDDLGSGLTMIAILSEVVKKQLAEPEKAKELLEKIAESSRDLVDNLQDIIWLLNPQNDTIESLSSYIREYGLKYFEPLAVHVDFNYPEKFSTFRLSEEQRRNTFLSVKESFNNIAKHAGCSKIIVSIQESSTEFRLCIADNGKGFDMNSVRLFANGLNNIQNRIEQANGSYFITSEPGKGTLTEIKFTI
jgi:signal transduction histidine kinase/ligand-binding sensor domain-containing protein